MTTKIPLKFGTHLKKHTKQRDREAGGSIFSAAGRNRYKDIEDGIRRLSKAFSFRDIHTNDEEPGLYCKYPRITMMKQQNDSLHSITAQELIARINERHHSDTKQNTWIDIQGTHDEMNEIARVFGLHPLTLEDCITFDTREKISITSNYIYLVIHDVSLPGDKGVNLNMILFPDLLLTLHEKPVHSIYDVVPKLSYCDDTEIPSIEYLVYVILSSIVSFYGAHVEQIRQGADLLDDKVMRHSTGRKDTKERKTSKQEKQETSDLLASLSAALKRASNLRQNISIKKDLLASLTRQEELFSKKGMQYLKSAYDQVLKMDLQVSLLHDMINDIHELCMAKISVQLAVAANEVGDNSRQFAVISAIFLPATLISGILGMNVKVPSGFDPDHHNIVPFVVVILVMITMSVLQLFLYRKMKWL